VTRLFDALRGPPNELIEADAALSIKAGVTVENGLALSQAISLKRIADRMEKITTLFGDGSSSRSSSRSSRWRLVWRDAELLSAAPRESLISSRSEIEEAREALNDALAKIG
jgi:hypothetical protein